MVRCGAGLVLTVFFFACRPPESPAQVPPLVDAASPQPAHVTSSSLPSSVVDAGTPTLVNTLGQTAPDAGEPAEPEDDEGDASEAFEAALLHHTKRVSVGDLDAVRKEGAIRILTRNNATSYYLYKGRRYGFDYDVAKLLGQELGLRVEVVVPPTRRDLVPYLLEGRGDIIMAGMATDADRADRVAFSQVVLETPWVVVMRKDRASTVKEAKDLDGKTVLMTASTGALKHIRRAGTMLGIHIKARAAPESLEQEDLLELVDSGEVDGALLERQVAEVELANEPQLVIATELPGEKEQVAWAVRKENTQLLAAANRFLERHHRGVEWNVLYKRYHTPSQRAVREREPEWRADRDGAITPWDKEFKHAAKEMDLDWRLLAAQAYQESMFDPKVRSHAGAVGLMQLMPSLARSMGVKNPKDPLQSLQAGARYMRKLLDQFKDERIPFKDQVRFALASYNVGRGHVEDARKLAAKRGLDANRWFDNVAKAVLLLSKPKYHRKARYGYCRGQEPVGYVSAIQARYEAYVDLTDRTVEASR